MRFNSLNNEIRRIILILPMSVEGRATRDEKEIVKSSKTGVGPHTVVLYQRCLLPFCCYKLGVEQDPQTRALTVM